MQAVKGGTGKNFSDMEQRKSMYLWMDYQCKLSPGTKMLYSEVSLTTLLDDKGQYINYGKNGTRNLCCIRGLMFIPPTAIVGQLESERSIIMSVIAN